jgi:hypothetical protein
MEERREIIRIMTEDGLRDCMMSDAMNAKPDGRLMAFRLGASRRSPTAESWLGGVASEIQIGAPQGIVARFLT